LKKYLPYFIGAVILLALGTLLISAMKNKPKQLNERITLKERDKIPYGFFAARRMLPDLFPNATIFDDKNSPGYWDALSETGTNQLVIITGIAIQADEYELSEMMAFARKGNYVFIIAHDLSYETTQFLNIVELTDDGDFFGMQTDSLRLQLQFPRFNDTVTYVYPGRRYASYLKVVDTSKVVVLGTNEKWDANFVQFKTGQGAIFLHTAPLAFSNYFLLHKSNVKYFQKALSLIPSTVEKVWWNEYYLNKRTDQPKNEPNFLSVLLKYEAFRWALITVIATLLIYVLMEMRRKQRVIPVLSKHKNESLDFVTTIGQLYYSRKDHANLARKMSTYFLEHIRTRLKVSTNRLDESFVQALHAKTGYPVEEIRSIVYFIQVTDTASVSEGQLNRFYQQLENFYKNT
jgi:hypothetical protein